MLLMIERIDVAEVLFYPAAVEASSSDRQEVEKVHVFLRCVNRIAAN